MSLFMCSVLLLLPMPKIKRSPGRKPWVRHPTKATVFKVPLDSYITGELTILDTGIEIRDGIEPTPFVWDAAVQLPWNPEAAALVRRPKVNIKRIYLNAVSILTVKCVLDRRHPNVLSVTFGLCDDGIGVDQLKLDERCEVASVSWFAFDGTNIGRMRPMGV